MTFFSLLIVGVESYFFTWSYSVTHTDSVGILWTTDRPFAEISTWHHTTLTRNRYLGSRRNSNAQSQQHASSRRPAPHNARPQISAVLWYFVQTCRFISTKHFVSYTLFCAFVAGELMCHARTHTSTHTGALWLKTLQDNRRNFDSFSRRLSTKSYINVPINNQLDAQFILYIFISIFYTFRAAMCSSSGKSIVSIQHLVYVTLCRWPFGMQVGKELPYLHT